MTTTKYEIADYDWEYTDDDTWQYVDEDLSMIITLQRDQYSYNISDDDAEDAYNVTAQSATYADENNYYCYDAMSKDYAYGPIITRVPAYAVLDPYGDPRSLVLPDWLINRMQYLVECDDFVANCAYSWAHENVDTVWASSEERDKSAEEWFGRNYPDGDERAPWGHEDMLYMADMHCMLTHHDGQYGVQD